MCGRVPQDRPLELWVISNFRVSNLIFSLSFILKAWPLIKKSAISQSQNHLVFSGFVSYHHHRKVVQCAMVIFPGSTKRLTFCFGFDFFSTTKSKLCQNLEFPFMFDQIPYTSKSKHCIRKSKPWIFKTNKFWFSFHFGVPQSFV